MRYRKKPVVIEAVQLRLDTRDEMCEHAGVGKLSDGKPEWLYVGGRIGLRIPTPEGVMLGVEGDWIIKGVAGELYPCKPNVFDVTYEPVESVRAVRVSDE
ncbi:MAG: hypothetical protein ACRD3C_12430 [Vicinamibacterales bacterium]